MRDNVNVPKPVVEYDVGSVRDFAIGRFQPVDIPGKDIWVLRTPDGRFYGLKNTCPHRAAPICRGSVDGTYLPSEPGQYVFGMEYQLIRCPYHGYEYSLDTGMALFADVRERVVRYQVRTKEDRVLVSGKGM
jgi:nitrite reductase (NADH) small subunit